MSKDDVAVLPIGPRIGFCIQALEKEKMMRNRVLKGTDRVNKVEEMEICLDYLKDINEALHRHKDMVVRLRECAERHDIKLDGGYIDQLVIKALDKAISERGSHG